jgi:ABC-type thiamine transport system ATPase subunit
LFGPSGAGKTTVLEAIAGLVIPRAASIELSGRILTQTRPPRITVPPWQRGVGLLRQDPALFPHLSVRANLTYARTAGGARGRSSGASTGASSGAAGPAPAGNETELAEVVAALGIGGLLDAMPARLSGGQQHRVALARLLLAHCDALLLDEPYSGLDGVLRRTLTGLVVRLATERNVPAVLVAHELADAQAFASQLAIIDHGQLLQLGKPDEVVLRPASMRVAELVGYLGFAAVPGRPGVLAGIHPDRVEAGAVTGHGLRLTGPVAASRPAGAGWEVDLLLPGAHPPGSVVTCRLSEPTDDDAAGVTVTAINPPLFGPDGSALDETLPADRGRPPPAYEHIGEGGGQ